MTLLEYNTQRWPLLCVHYIIVERLAKILSEVKAIVAAFYNKKVVIVAFFQYISIDVKVEDLY